MPKLSLEIAPNRGKAFLLASRPKTWTAGLSPVMIGGALAAKNTPLAFDLFFLTLFFSLLIQIGTNYANDYFDFVNGADTAERKGPKRAVSQGWISPSHMLIATILTFATALVIAIPLIATAGLWSLGPAALCVLFGVIYTGGPKPLGYCGFGELLVLIFFGPVAVMGTYFLQTGTADILVFIASLAPGCLSAAILMANNLRDEKTDRIANKNTLVVQFGSTFGHWTYTAFIVAAFLVPISLTFVHFSTKLLLAACPLLFAPIRKVFLSIEVLQETSLLLLIYTVLFCVCIF